MIKDPYIGMPITMGGRCDTVPSNPVKPPQNPNPSPSPNPSPNPEMPGGGGAGNQGGTSGSGGNNRPGTNASGFDAMYLGSLPIAMSYTPMQQWKTTYSAEKGLSRGTIFPELDLPFEGRTILSERSKGGRM